MRISRYTIAVGLLFLLALSIQPVFAQGGKGAGAPVDLVGTWRKIGHEDTHERGSGPDPGEYWGLPVNDAARMRADTYNEEWVTTSQIMQCRPHPLGYQPLGPDPMRIEQIVDPINRQVVALGVSYDETPGNRMIWLDGRPHPNQYAMHSWEGFSTGHFKGDTMIVESSHLKEGLHRRNGVPASFRAYVVEHISLDEPYMTWVVTTYDPDYLTEPAVRSATYVRAPTVQIPPYPCNPTQEEHLAGKNEYRMPHYFAGENPYLTEVAAKYKAPLEGVRGGAETTYPEWRAKGLTLPIPQDRITIKPAYTDASTKAAEMADAKPKVAPSYDKVEVVHASDNIYMIAGAGGNIAVSSGADGVFLVDSGAAAASPKVLDAIAKITGDLRTSPHPEGAIAAGDFWQATHAYRPPTIRMIINTNLNPDHTGGNGNIRDSKFFKGIGVEGEDELASEVILANELVQRRMLEENAPARSVPTNTFFSLRQDLHRFANGSAVQIYHTPDAITDGDSFVWFRRADVIAAGDLYNSDIYPPLNVDKGGSIDGVISGLNQIFDLCAVEFMSQGGTVIIPGHGWLSDAADLEYYRDMLMVLRDRIQAMIDKKMTLAQIKAAKPTMDYDVEYGREPGVTSNFVEAVYRSLTEKKRK
ncbi:MAG: MBL fold metallo-hydrolase [Bryobacteraceae bacterium]